MNANQADLPVHTMCRILQVSASGYYDWHERAPSERARANAELTQRIAEVHRASDATYGAPRIHAELAEAGIVAGHNRIARLMRLHGLRGVSRRRRWCVTTRRDPRQRPAPDLVQRQFTATVRTAARILHVDAQLLDTLLTWDQVAGIEVMEFDGDRIRHMTKIWNDGFALKQVGWV